jgi:D-alanyl-D-alanine carboxypeptidase/D-alanyl-D-alanine-endopeptidase (penicillin-binding protein 4)
MRLFSLRSTSIALALAATAGVVFAAQTLADEAATDRDARLARALETALGARALRGATVGVLVVDDADGHTVFAKHPDRPLVPASNLKILTALAALRAFGPSHVFTTRVFADAAPDAEGAVGTLFVQGGGDPGLTSEDLWRLAADLRRIGLRRVKGGIAIDDALFDGERWHPSWLPTSARAYHGPVGAFMANYGAFAVVVRGGARDGEPVGVTLDPPVDFFRVANRAKTGGGRALVVDRRAVEGAEEVVVGGAWPRGAERTFHRSVLDPGAYAASVLRLQLEGLGIRVEGAVRRAYVPEGAKELVAFEGRPLSSVVRRFLKYSSNPIGEALVKALAVRANGAPGTWSRGVAAVRAELDALGLPTEGLVQVDGSGLSYDNRVTPRLLVEALRAGTASFEYGPELVSGLPIAGSDGTLAKRAEVAGAAVRAKTGLLTRISGLTGLARRPDGTTLAFSIVVNGFPGGASEAMDALDAFAAALVATR